MKEIKVTTLPNGYGLDVDGEGYMYFNEVDLLAGFIVHVGAGETNSMDSGSILNTLASMMLGHEYAEQVDNLRERMSILAKQQKAEMKVVDDVNKYIAACKPKFDGYKDRINELDRILKTSVEDYHLLTQPVREAKEEIKKITAAMSSITAKINKYTKFFEDLEGEATRVKELIKEASEMMASAKKKEKPSKKEMDAALKEQVKKGNLKA